MNDFLSGGVDDLGETVSDIAGDGAGAGDEASENDGSGVSDGEEA